MNNQLVVKSKIIHLDLKYYLQGRAVIDNGFIIKDSYVTRTKTSHGEYCFTIESPPINNDEDLSFALRKASSLINRITLLNKCILLEALNTSEYETDVFTKYISIVGKMPQGWISNYKDVKEEIDRRKRTFLSIVEVIPTHFVEQEKSPFMDFMNALKMYSKVNRVYIDLLQIINDADLVSFSARYLLLGKALEIVDSLYPLKHRKDNRIVELFPELESYFNGTTLKDLLTLANNRKETRHYIAEKSTLTSHQSMNEEELKKFYYLTNLLCINIIRKQLGLELTCWEM